MKKQCIYSTITALFLMASTPVIARDDLCPFPEKGFVAVEYLSGKIIFGYNDGEKIARLAPYSNLKENLTAFDNYASPDHFTQAQIDRVFDIFNDASLFSETIKGMQYQDKIGKLHNIVGIYYRDNSPTPTFTFSTASDNEKIDFVNNMDDIGSFVDTLGDYLSQLQDVTRQKMPSLCV